MCEEEAENAGSAPIHTLAVYFKESRAYCTFVMCLQYEQACGADQRSMGRGWLIRTLCPSCKCKYTVQSWCFIVYCVRFTTDFVNCVEEVSSYDEAHTCCGSSAGQ